MRVNSLFRSQPPPAKAALATRLQESERDLSALLAEPVVRGASAESWERARRWGSTD